MALQGYYTPYPLPTNIENQEEAWNIPFDRNSSRQEFNKRPTTEIDYKWKLYLSFHFTDVYPDTKLEYRCRLDKKLRLDIILIDLK